MNFFLFADSEEVEELFWGPQFSPFWLGSLEPEVRLLNEGAVRSFREPCLEARGFHRKTGSLWLVEGDVRRGGLCGAEGRALDFSRGPQVMVDSQQVLREACR